LIKASITTTLEARLVQTSTITMLAQEPDRILITTTRARPLEPSNFFFRMASSILYSKIKYLFLNDDFLFSNYKASITTTRAAYSAPILTTTMQASLDPVQL
jgi:hypothetical protein